MTTRTSAPAQACLCQSAYGENRVREHLDRERRDRLVEARGEEPVVEGRKEQRARLAGDTSQRSTTPVRIPGSAAGKTTVNTAAPVSRRAPARPRAWCREQAAAAPRRPRDDRDHHDPEREPPASALNCLNGSTAMP
jgi:hypothetical protein